MEMIVIWKKGIKEPEAEPLPPKKIPEQGLQSLK
jgi:hypothetical protein